MGRKSSQKKKKKEHSALERPSILTSQAEAGNVYVVNGTWLNDFFDELDVFPDGQHDDQVDAASGAFTFLTDGGSINLRWV